MDLHTPTEKGKWFHTVLRICGAYVVLTSLGFAIWKATGDDAGYQLVALLVGFLLAGVILAVVAIVALLRRHSVTGMLALVFLAWALVSAWSVVDRLARAE